MLNDLRQLIAAVDRLRAEVAKHAGKQVERASVRAAGKQIVDSYFRDLRGLAQNVPASALDLVDGAMQDLLSLTHHRSTKTSYKTTLREVRARLEDLERLALTTSGPQPASGDPLDLRIIGVLKPLLPGAALSYEQAILDLQRGERLSWRGPATDLREALRETLDHLAPDKEVIASAGFKLEAGLNGPSMKQKVRFVLKKRGLSESASQAPESAADAVDTAVGAFRALRLHAI